MATFIKRHTLTRHSATIEVYGQEVTVELVTEPMSDDSNHIFVIEKGDGKTFAVGLLLQDEDCPSPLDGESHIYTSHRYAGRETHAAMQAALGLDQYWNRDPDLTPNPDAVILDVYSHGTDHYSVSGEGMQCEWDTARGGAVWVPAPDLIDHLATFINQTDRRNECIKVARSTCEMYTNWVNGWCYGYWYMTYTLDGEILTEGYLDFDSDESCWGYYSHEDAVGGMKAAVGWEKEASDANR